MRTLFLLVASLGPMSGDGLAPPAPLEGGSIVSFELLEDPGLEHEYFELVLGGERVGSVASTIGLRSGGLRAEMQFHMPAIETRVHHVERLTPSGPRLVWREVRERSGRTVLAEWSRDGEQLVDIGWSGGDAVRRETTPPAGALLPLFLVDSVRSGGFPAGVFDVFVPLSGSVEELDVRVERIAWGTRVATAWLAPRRLVLRRADGTLAGEYLFLAKELVCFRAQEGGPVAVRISLSTYRQHEREAERLRAEARSKDAG